MPDPSKRVTHIDFAEGLTIEVAQKRTPVMQESPQAQPVPRIPPDLAPRAEHPLEKIMREKYEQRARAAFARGLSVPNMKVPGASWSDAVDMGMQWLFESGANRVVYRDGTPQVHDMMYAHRVIEARNYFYDKNADLIKKGQSLQPVTRYSGSFYPTGPFKAGNNPTQQFVGSYNIDIYPNKSHTITFVLTNVTSLKSGTYHLGPEYPRGTVGLGGNQIQIYTWTEQVWLPTYGK